MGCHFSIERDELINCFLDSDFGINRRRQDFCQFAGIPKNKDAAFEHSCYTFECLFGMIMTSENRDYAV